VQALLARGDERLAGVVERVYRKGGVFQEWSERFSYGLWTAACVEEGVEAEEYLAERPAGSPLPWDFVDAGVSRGFLLEEYRKALAGKVTPDCASGECTGCGACPDRRPPPVPAAAPAEERAYGRRARPGRGFDELKTRLRLKYAVGEQFRYAAHLDRVRAFYRSLRRSDLPVVYTEGFAPKPMLSFGPPLPVGLLSDGEYLDVFTSYSYSGNIARDLGTFLPKGLRIAAGQPVPRSAPSLGQAVNLGRYRVRTTVDAAEMRRRAQELPAVRSIARAGTDEVEFDLAIVPGVKLFRVIGPLLGIEEAEARRLHIRRRDCLVVEGGRIVTPLGEPAGQTPAAPIPTGR
jgi:hypothetical protein